MLNAGRVRRIGSSATWLQSGTATGSTAFRRTNVSPSSAVLVAMSPPQPWIRPAG
jgi:hypothetical protein